MAKQYSVSEVFYSIQGEGQHVGRPAVFVRFAGCNLKCSFCDTPQRGEHCDGYTKMTARQIAAAMDEGSQSAASLCVLTGGEPGLQIDADLVRRIKELFFTVAVETNGTRKLPKNVDHVVCSPKPHIPLALRRCDELKVVIDCMATAEWFKEETRAKRWPRALYREVMPVFRNGQPDPWALEFCRDWVLANPRWFLTSQVHKWWGVR